MTWRAAVSSRKVGLALGSGVARGLAHIGVLKVLRNHGIPVDMIAGTSMGAVVGASYAIRGDVTRLEEIALGMSRMHVLSLVDLTLPRTGLISGRRVVAWGKSLIGSDVQFSDLKTPFSCVATDIMTGQEVVITEGSVLEAVRASISIPGVFALARLDGKYLADGGLVNPVPVNTARQMGADIIIAVNVLPDIGPEKTRWAARSSEGEPRPPSLIEVLMQSAYIGSHALARTSLLGADVVIEPRVAHIGPSEFHRAKECVLEGELAAEDAIPAISRLLKQD
jgi:NTE family protein